MKRIEKLKMYVEAMIGDEDKVETVMNVAAGVIVKEGDNGEKLVLLIQRAADDHWPLHFEFPRGKCDKGKNEDVKKCLLREVKEETGLDVVVEDFLGKFIYYADEGKRKSICYNYLCTMKNKNQKVKLSFEHEAYKWIMQSGEAELMVHPDQKRYIEKVLSIENSIKNRPTNNFTVNNKLDEYLTYIHENHPIHRRRAMIKRIEILKAKRSLCHKMRNPEKCNLDYNKKIILLQSKVDKLSNLRL